MSVYPKEPHPIQMDSTLARRIVSLKSLRNDCLHVRPVSTDVWSYRVAASLAGTVLDIRPEHLAVVLRTLATTTKSLAIRWSIDEHFVAPHNSRRINLISDLPKLAKLMASRLATEEPVQ